MTDTTGYEERRFWVIEPFETMKRNGEIQDYCYKPETKTICVVPVVCAKDIAVNIGFTKDLSNLNENFGE